MVVAQEAQKTEFGVLPVNWNVTTVSDLVSKNIIAPPMDGNHGEIHPKKSDFVSDGIPFVMASDLVSGHVDYDSCNFITEKQAKTLRKGFAQLGDILISHKATIGEVGLIAKNRFPFLMLTPQVTYYRVLDTSELSPLFLFQFMQSELFQQEMREQAGGGTRAYIGITSQYSLPLVLPPLKEQQAIAEALSDADALIASLEKLIEKKQKIKSALMRHHFFDPKKERNGYFPLGEVAKIYQSETISNSEMSNYGYPVYGANGQIGFFHKYNHEDWQVTVTCRGSTCGTVGRTVERSWITGNAMVINTDEQESVYKPYLYHFLCSVDFSNLITGTGQPQIVREPLRNIQIMLPDLDEQKKIASQLEELDDLLSRYKERFHKAIKVKAGMMQELLTGRTRLI